MKWLVDSDFLFALFITKDVHHLKAKAKYFELNQGGASLLVTNIVIQESATVLSKKVSQAVAKKFYRDYPELGMREVVVEPKIEKLTWDLFMKQREDGISFIDCVNVVLTKEMGLDGILSFDKFYRQVGIKSTS